MALENSEVKVVDTETRKTIRVFSTNDSQVTSMTFSSDARWLLAASSDRSVRIWDLPRAQLIDVFMFNSPCISMSMSPTGEFLATCHEDDLGVYLWSNITLFAPINLKPLNDEYVPKTIGLPQVRVDDDDKDEENDNELESTDVAESQMEVEEQFYLSPEQLDEQLITFSSLPSSRWKNLLNIDLIKVSENRLIHFASILFFHRFRKEISRRNLQKLPKQHRFFYLRSPV